MPYLPLVDLTTKRPDLHGPISLTLDNEEDSSCTSSLENQIMLSAHVVRLTPLRLFAAVDLSCLDKPVLPFAFTPQSLGLSQWPSLFVLSDSF
jgi:hypothetical protein